jgi:glycosyltransferase involved in cell wall biosynthesis
VSGVQQGDAAVHQFVPMLHLGDAVGGHTLAVQAELRARGLASEIYVELEDPETAGRTRRAIDYPGDAATGDVLVYQMATASDLAPWLLRRPEPLVVNYHNLTPPALFAPWDNSLARHQVVAMGQLAALARRARLGIAVSEFNRADLVAAGFAETAVVPPVVTLTAASDGPAVAASAGRASRPGGRRWLSVGRLAPNKAFEDVVAALLWQRSICHPDATLRVVGRAAVPSYASALARWTAELGLAGAVRFEGRLSDEELRAAYDDADVLVVTSEHEGFCLPVVEAMAHGVPVVAYRQGAVPEVLSDAGVLLDDKDPRTIAAAVERLAADEGHRRAVVAAGFARLPELGLRDAGQHLVDRLLAARSAAGT